MITVYVSHFKVQFKASSELSNLGKSSVDWLLSSHVRLHSSAYQDHCWHLGEARPSSWHWLLELDSTDIGTRKAPDVSAVRLKLTNAANTPTTMPAIAPGPGEESSLAVPNGPLEVGAGAAPGCTVPFFLPSDPLLVRNIRL
jgi:hypothetical protein